MIVMMTARTPSLNASRRLDSVENCTITGISASMAAVLLSQNVSADGFAGLTCVTEAF
jgi:hypothetical protein